MVQILTNLVLVWTLLYQLRTSKANMESGKTIRIAYMITSWLLWIVIFIIFAYSLIKKGHNMRVI